MGYVLSTDNLSVEAAWKRMHRGDARVGGASRQWGRCIQEHAVHRVVAEWIDSNRWRGLHEWRGMHGNGRPDFSVEIEGMTYAIECKDTLQAGRWSRFHDYTRCYDAVIVVCNKATISLEYAASIYGMDGIGLRIASSIDVPLAIERPRDRRHTEGIYDYSAVTRRLLTNDCDLLWKGAVVSAHGWGNDAEEDNRKAQISQAVGLDVRMKRCPGNPNWRRKPSE